eukprot:6167026-Pyramimonas_sp.AAC.1
MIGALRALWSAWLWPWRGRGLSVKFRAINVAAADKRRAALGSCASRVNRSRRGGSATRRRALRPRS